MTDKRITEWGHEEVLAMFGGLPDKAAVFKYGDRVIVANAREVTYHHEVGLTTMEVPLVQDATGNHMVIHQSSPEIDRHLATVNDPGSYSDTELGTALAWLNEHGYRLTADS